ncbi:sugar phosphate nucleotidyltransferase [Candidatus Neomarinimicrobiota bacterium]
MLPVGGKAVLDHILEPLLAARITEVSLVVGHRGDQVSERMVKYRDLRITFIKRYQQKGLEEAIFMTLAEESEPVVIVLGDSILEIDYTGFINSSHNLIGVVEVDDPRRFGIVGATGRRGSRSWQKSPTSRYPTKLSRASTALTIKASSDKPDIYHGQLRQDPG